MELQYIEMGMRIKHRRKELKMKQADLAEVLCISNNHLSSIENGKQKPSLDIFVNLCDHLHVTPDYLLLGTMHAYNVPQTFSISYVYAIKQILNLLAILLNYS